MVNPNVTSLLTLIIIGLPTSVRALSHNRERMSPPFMFTCIQTSGKVHSITTPVTWTLMERGGGGPGEIPDVACRFKEMPMFLVDFFFKFPLQS